MRVSYILSCVCGRFLTRRGFRLLLRYQHPFITKNRNKAELIELIDRCNEAVAQRGYRFASDSDDDDDSV